MKFSVAPLALFGLGLWLAVASVHADWEDKSLAVTSIPGESGECVILLHGLARTAASMDDLAETLAEAGYAVANVDYPSRHHPIEELADMAVPAGVGACLAMRARKLNFVTHSLGGILVRQHLSSSSTLSFDDYSLGRIVMLAPPNQGSEAVDAMRDVPGFRWLNGPAGQQLGTGADSVPRRLGPIDVDVGIIAGTDSINLILSNYLPNPDDGKVSVASTRIEGMCAHLAMPVSHTYIMSDDAVIAEVLSFLSSGRMLDDRTKYPDCPARSLPEN